MFPSDPPLTISVNLSGKQFAQPNLIGQIEQILKETCIEPGTLKLEITESAIIGLAGSSPAWRTCASSSPFPQLPHTVLASAAVTSSVRPSALPTSRMALRAR